MGKVNFKRIESSSNIDNINIVDGNFIVTGDGKTFVDYGTNRIPTSGTPDSEMSDTSRNTVENNIVKKYVDDSVGTVSYELITSGNWKYKKYDNGLIEMYYRAVISPNINTQYIDSVPVYYSAVEGVNFPITLTNVYTVAPCIQAEARLWSIHINKYTNSYITYFLSDYQVNSGINATLNFIIIGTWK